jgi:hypothetical protein
MVSNRPKGPSRLGLWTLVVGVGFLLAAVPLQFLISLFVRTDSTLTLLAANVVWVAWLIWLIAAVALFVVWIVKSVRRSGT